MPANYRDRDDSGKLAAIASKDVHNNALLTQVQLFRWIEKDDGIQELQTECGYHGHILALHMQVNEAVCIAPYFCARLAVWCSEKTSLARFSHRLPCYPRLACLRLVPLNHLSVLAKSKTCTWLRSKPTPKQYLSFLFRLRCRLTSAAAVYRQSRGDFIIVGDLMRSVSLLVYKAVDGAIEVSAVRLFAAIPAALLLLVR